MKCANCNNELAPITYEGGVVVDACDQCSGMYLDSGELEKIQDNKDNDYSDMLACHPPLLERT
ncbi:MAG: zf-TFIIB domain-containing protein, partial [Verrucomicrobiota bacterium]|nr:zf-TFIIB domain-containing protein [Verrucomicrobiota bacterium]